MLQRPISESVRESVDIASQKFFAIRTSTVTQEHDQVIMIDEPEKDFKRIHHKLE